MRTNIKKTLCFMLCAVMLLGLLPTVVVLSASGGADIVFAVDNGKDMQNYDPSADNGWLDALTGLIEQAPGESGFGVVTRDETIGLTDAETITDVLYNVPLYYGDSNPSTLLSQAANTLAGSSKQKIIVLSTSKWYNELKEQAQELESQGILVYIIAFETDMETAESISTSYDHAIVCANVQEVSYRMADVYESVANLPPYSSGMMLMLNASESYNSSFRGGTTGKHNYGFDVTTSQKGTALAALLNMYYLMPSRVSGGYTLSGEQIKKIGSGVTNGLFTDSSTASLVLSFWESKAASLLNATAYTGTSIGITGQISIIEENIKRRFPILISAGTMDISDTSNKYYLITKLENSGNGYTFNVYDPSSDSDTANTKSTSDFDGKYVRVLDTQKYFNSIYATHTVKTTLEGKNATLSLPSGYSGQAKKYIDSSESSLAISDNSITISVTSGEVFSVAMDVQWNGLLPDIHNATMNFRIILFTDVEPSYWARPYILTMTNQKVISGYPDAKFKPEPLSIPNADDPNYGIATIAEYLTMAVRAADVEGHEAWDDATWPAGYMNYAMDPERKLLSLGTNGSQLISREQAFDLTWKILTSDDCRTPTQLVKYNVGVFINAVPFTDKINVWSDYQNSITELYKNGVVTGFPEGDLKPKNTITRAQTAKTLSKCIARFDEEKQISVGKIGGYDVLTQIPLDVTISGIIGDKGGMAFSFHTDDTGLYPITATGNVSFTIYEQVGTGTDIKFHRVYEKANKTGYQYPILENKNMIVAVSGVADTSFSIRVGESTEGNRDRTNETKTIQIPLYDSPDRDALLNEFIMGKGYTKDNETNPNRYLDPSGNKYNYSVGFFENYLKALGNNTVVFSINIRDVDFDMNDVNYGSESDREIPYEKLDEWSAFITPKLVNMIGSISVNLKTAYDNLPSGQKPSTMPKICIGTPHVAGRFYGAEYTDMRNAFVQKYLICTENLYDGVKNHLTTNGATEDMIYGIYFGKEDPLNEISYGIPHDTDPEYAMMVEISKYIHGKTNSDGTSKKHVWMPYTVGNRDVLKDIGRTANIGMYLGSDNKIHDIFDVIIIQPGFYYKEIHEASQSVESEQEVMQYDTLKSMQENRVVYFAGNDIEGQPIYYVQDGGKMTDTVIGFQIEFDGGLYSGRAYNVTTTDALQISQPYKKAGRFATTVKTFYSLIYNSNCTYGMYTGGPNEQGFTAGIVDGGKSNVNRHSNKNHITFLDTISGKNGNLLPYKDFWSEVTPFEYNNNATSYNGALIFDVINGLLNNNWSVEVQIYFAGLLQFNGAALLNN